MPQPATAPNALGFHPDTAIRPDGDGILWVHCPRCDTPTVTIEPDDTLGSIVGVHEYHLAYCTD